MTAETTAPITAPHPPRRPRRGCLSFAAALLVLPASAQTTYRIAGTAVSAQTHQPVQNATISVTTIPGNHPFLSVTTDENGRFSIPGLPAGAFQLSGTARGFLPVNNYLQHGEFSSAIITGAAVATESLTLALRPLGSVSGVVADEFAEPVRNAQVHLYVRSLQYGDGRIVSTGTITTNDLGHYEFPRLQPGTYFLAVTAQPWYATHPQPNQSFQQPFGITGPVDPALDVAYPVTFFPGATDQARAEPIRVDGNAARADLQLTPTPAITLTIPRDPAQNNNRPFPQLRVTIFGQPQFVNAQPGITATEATLSGIAPGDYIIQIPTLNGQPGEETPAHLTRDSPNTVPAEATRARVHLTVRSADGSPLPRNTYAALVRVGATTYTEGTNLSAKGEADLAPAQGSYYLQVTAGNRPLLLRGITVDKKPQPDGTFTLSATSNASLSVTAIPGTQTLRGVVQKDGSPCPGAMLLLLPAESHTDLRTYFRQQSELDGSFEITNLAPGPYLLLAFDDTAWDLNWAAPEFLARHLPQSIPVVIPGSPVTSRLPSPVVVQLP